MCGPNAIEVEIQPIWKLLVKQVTTNCLLFFLVGGNLSSTPILYLFLVDTDADLF